MGGLAKGRRRRRLTWPSRRSRRLEARVTNLPGVESIQGCTPYLFHESLVQASHVADVKLAAPGVARKHDHLQSGLGPHQRHRLDHLGGLASHIDDGRCGQRLQWREGSPGFAHIPRRERREGGLVGVSEGARSCRRERRRRLLRAEDGLQPGPEALMSP